jgi:hypothetical protein
MFLLKSDISLAGTVVISVVGYIMLSGRALRYIEVDGRYFVEVGWNGPLLARKGDLYAAALCCH